MPFYMGRNNEIGRCYITDLAGKELIEQTKEYKLDWTDVETIPFDAGGPVMVDKDFIVRWGLFETWNHQTDLLKRCLDSVASDNPKFCCFRAWLRKYVFHIDTAKELKSILEKSKPYASPRTTGSAPNPV